MKWSRGNQYPNVNGVFDFLEREGPPSLYNIKISNRRQSSGREGKTFYAEQATRGHQKVGVLTNSKR